MWAAWKDCILTLYPKRFRVGSYDLFVCVFRQLLYTINQLNVQSQFIDYADYGMFYEISRSILHGTTYL